MNAFLWNKNSNRDCFENWNALNVFENYYNFDNVCSHWTNQFTIQFLKTPIYSQNTFSTTYGTRFDQMLLTTAHQYYIQRMSKGVNIDILW